MTLILFQVLNKIWLYIRLVYLILFGFTGYINRWDFLVNILLFE